MKNVKNFLLTLCFALCLTFLAGCQPKTGSSTENTQNSSTEKAEKAEIGGTFLDGTSCKPEEYAGKVVLLDFWATWCPPCRREITSTIVPMYAKYHEAGLEIIGVSCDQNAETVQAYTQQNGITWKQMLESAAVTSSGTSLAEHYGVQYIPFPVLIGRNGKVVATNLHGTELESAVVAELKK